MRAKVSLIALSLTVFGSNIIVIPFDGPPVDQTRIRVQFVHCFQRQLCTRLFIIIRYVLDVKTKLN